MGDNKENKENNVYIESTKDLKPYGWGGNTYNFALFLVGNFRLSLA